MKEILVDTWQLFTNNLVKILHISLPFLLATSILNGMDQHVWQNSNYLSAITPIIEQLIELSFAPIFILFLSQVVTNETSTKKQLIYNGLTYAPYIIIVFILTFVPMLAFWALELVVELITHKYSSSPFSMIFKVLLTVFVFIKLSFSNCLIVLEGNKPIESIKNSFMFTKGYELKIILSMLAFSIPILAAGFVGNYILPELIINNFATSIFTYFLFTFLLLLVQVAMFKIYCINYIERQNNRPMA
nr:putative uncharacterized protein [uncultured bacterium]BAJ06953.1 putative uncharacterized protein [uncultured bacterium]